MSFPRYPRYKDSGVEWLGEVPEHWEVLPLKRYYRCATDGAHISPETEDGVFPFVSTKDLSAGTIDFDGCLRTSKPTYDYMVRTGCRPLAGDLLFSKDGTVGRTAVVRETREFAVASSLIIVRPEPQALHCEFLNYLCQSRLVSGQVDRFVKGAGLPRLSIQNFLKVSGCVPPLPDQVAISAFLDHETARIDALISEQERLIELLQEKRQAVISHAVTKGLDPDAPMKDSGVEWLGEVPEHWQVRTLKHLITRIEQGWSPPCESYPAQIGDWGVLKVGCGNGNVFDANEQKALPVEVEPQPQYEVKPGDILMSRGNTLELVGAATLIEQVPPRLLLSDLLYRFRARVESVDPAYLVHSLRSRYGRLQIERSATGTSASMKKIGQGDIHDLVVFLPPLTEQAAIVAHIRAVSSAVDQLVTEAHRAINLLNERRAALITAAVTGQIDVRGLANSDAA